MTKSMRWMSGSLSSAAILLSACGGGGGEDSGSQLTTPVTLATKADGLRELGIVLGEGPIADQIELPTASDISARGKTARAKLVITDECNGGGGYTYEEGEKARDFNLLIPTAKQVLVNFSKSTPRNCRFVSTEGAFSFTEISDGPNEGGSSETLSDGSSFRYRVRGGGSESFVYGYEERENGRLVYESREEYRGAVESHQSSSGTSHAVLSEFKFLEKASGDTFTAHATLGEGTTPLRASVDASGTSFTVNGGYTYATSISVCSGGKVNVSTPSTGGITLTGGELTGGQLRLQSGSNTAMYTFANDGSATLVINNGTGIVLTAAEVRAAIGDPCSP